VFYYGCEYIGGELSIDGFDEVEKQYAQMAEWIPIKKLDSLELASTVDYRSYIRKVIKQ
jgi:hypothetical protein